MAGGGSGRPVKLVVEQASKFYETRSGRVRGARPVLDGGPAGASSSASSARRGAGSRRCCGRWRGCTRSRGGRILLDGQEVTGPHPQIAMVFQEANLLPWRNLAEEHRAAVRDPAAGAGPGADRGAAGRGRAQRVRGQVPARALGRHAAAGVDRAGAVGRPVAAADGRAVRGARRVHPRGDEPADPGDLAGDREDDRLHHPLDPGGGVPGRPHLRHVGAAGPARRACSTSTCRGRAPSTVQTEPHFVELVAGHQGARSTTAPAAEGGLDVACGRPRAARHHPELRAGTRAAGETVDISNWSGVDLDARADPQRGRVGGDRAGGGDHHRRGGAPAALVQGAALHHADAEPDRDGAGHRLPADRAAHRLHAGRAGLRLRDRRLGRLRAGGGGHPVPVRREDHRALHPAARHHADAGAGAAADPEASASATARGSSPWRWPAGRW